MHAEPHTGPVHGYRKRELTSVLVAFALLSISLGCISAQVAFNITPASEGVADIKFTYTQDLSDDYIEAAKRANVDLQQDYAQAGQPAPATLFPESWTEMSAVGDTGLPDPNMTVTREDEHGYTAEASYSVSAGSDTPDFWNLTIGDVDEDGTQRYIFEVSTPKLAEDFDYAEFARNRDAPMPPKPPVVRDDADDGGSGLAGLMGAVQAIMEGTISELGIEGWYLLRISKEVALPVYTYKITMPGQITAHTINGQTVGTVDSSGSEFTLAINDTYLRTFGAGPKWIRIESQVSQCDAQCSAQPNMVWDRSAPGPGCTCVCEVGYESDDRGDCVACDQVCAAYDPLAVYDPRQPPQPVWLHVQRRYHGVRVGRGWRCVQVYRGSGAQGRRLRLQRRLRQEHRRHELRRRGSRGTQGELSARDKLPAESQRVYVRQRNGVRRAW